MKRKAMVFLCALLVLFLTGCVTASNPEGDPQFVFSDAQGREVRLWKAPERVVALQGSFGETWIQAGGTLVGVTADAREDLHLDLPGVREVGTVKEPNMDEVLLLSPDFVILSEDIVRHHEVARELDRFQIPYAFCKQESLEDYLGWLRIFTRITNREDLFQALGVEVEHRVEEVRKRAQEVTDKPSVLFVRAMSRGVSAKATDHMVCTMLDEFGCVNIAKEDGQLLENLSFEQIMIRDPDVILVTTMGDEQRARDYLKTAWESNPAWNKLKAVQNNRYVFLAKDRFHFKPNARWGDAYEELFEILF